MRGDLSALDTKALCVRLLRRTMGTESPKSYSSSALFIWFVFAKCWENEEIPRITNTLGRLVVLCHSRPADVMWAWVGMKQAVLVDKVQRPTREVPSTPKVGEENENKSSHSFCDQSVATCVKGLLHFLNIVRNPTIDAPKS